MKRLIVLLGVVILLGILFPAGSFSECETYVPVDNNGVRSGDGVPWVFMDDCFKTVVSSGDFIDIHFDRYEWYAQGETICSWGCYGAPGGVFHYYLYYDPERNQQGLPDCFTALYNWSHVPYVSYDPNTYDFDCDGTPDEYDDNPDAPAAQLTQGCNNDNTGAAYDNKTGITNNGGNGGMPGLLINLAHLNFVLNDKDISYLDHGSPIQIVRTYNAYSTYEGIFGRGWTFNYGIHLIEEQLSGDVVVVRGSGAEKRYTSNGDGTFTPPKAVYNQLTKNPDGTFVLWVKDAKLTYAFDANGVLTAVADSNGNTVTLSYDINNLLTTITDASGRTITFSYNANNQVETITDPLNRQITFTYENGDMKTSTDVAGVTTTFNYDTNHYLTDMTTPNGTTSFTYQDYVWGSRRLATVTDAEGNTTHYSISVNDEEVVVTDPEGYTTHYGYNYDGYTTYITDHLGNTTTYEYDTHGNRNKVIDADGKETSLVYDSQGNITAITNHLDQTTTFVYDGNDNLTDMADPLTRTSHFDYDANDNLTKITDPLTNESEFVYLSNGLLEKIIDARDKETTFTYDGYGNLETITDPLGHTTSFTYYPESDKIQTLTLPPPLSHTTEYEYDPLGRLTEITHPDTTAYIIHRYCSGISGITDENGLYTEYEHDNINQLTKIIHALAGYETEFEYDGNGNLVLLTDPKDQETTFEYYENNWLEKITYPEGAEELYTYNPVGTLQTKTDANSVVTTYGYDDLHRLTSITAPDLAITYTYDTVGNLDTMTDSTGFTDYAYDDLDRLTNITYPNAKTIDYTYDAVGNITSIATPFGTVTYGYYDNNLLHTITLPNTQQVLYQYDAADNLSRIDYPNGTYTVFAYDTRNRLTNLTNYAPGDTVISSYAYTLDGVGNRTDVDLLEPLIPDFEPGTINYTYNLGNILATADTISYTHDANGNRLQKVEGAVTVNYTYDPLNRLTQVTDGTQTTQYMYNGLGQRVGKIDNGVQTNYLIDPNGLLPQVLAEMDENNDLIAFYVYDGVGLVAKVTPTNEYYFYHYDGLGSTVAITDSSAQIVNAYAYSPYGMIGAQEIITNPFTYVGRFGVMAESHGLYYMRARYYDPEVGRFINKDPIGYVGGMNLFGYVRNNPIRFIDPLGLNSGEVALAVSLEVVYHVYVQAILYAGGVTGATASLVTFGVLLPFGYWEYKNLTKFYAADFYSDRRAYYAKKGTEYLFKMVHWVNILYKERCGELQESKKQEIEKLIAYYKRMARSSYFQEEKFGVKSDELWGRFIYPREIGVRN